MRVLFVSSGNKTLEISPIINSQGKALNQNGITVDYYNIKGHGIVGYLKNISNLRKKIQSDKYNLIHAHYGLCGLISLLAAIGIKHKLIVSFMGDDILGSNDVNGNVIFQSKLLATLNRFLAKHFYDYCIVKSNEMSNKLGSIKTKIIIPNGVDIEKFFPIELQKARHALKIDSLKKIILFVSNPERPEKNFELAQNAIRLLKSDEVELIVLSGVHHDILNLYFNAADALILTSFHEGSPNVVKEALACNCPVVSTNVGDVNILICDLEGNYITTYNPEDVANKIRQVLSEQKRTKGIERIHQFALDHNSVAKKIIELYNNVLII